MRMLVLGGGLQGSACAYDLLQDPAVESVRLGDRHADRLAPFLAPYSGPRLIPTMIDAHDTEAVLGAMRDVDAVCCALPYYYNTSMTRLAIEAGAHFCDLGGNTEIVMQQKAMNDAAAAKGITVIPDCGLAPGMVNVLAQHGIDQLDAVDSVRIYVGGLPQNPEPPLNYQIVYSLEGVLDYYTTLSWVVRDGKRTQVKALSERESVSFPAPVGELEAFHTAGGLSTMADRYADRIPTMEYKTLRYPGHAAIMEAIRDLGLIDNEPVEVKGARVSPRDVFIAAAGPRLRKQGPDLVALRVVVSGSKAGQAKTLTWELIDRFDEATGVTAMMRTTGYSLAITALMQARGEIKPAGVHTPDEAIPPGAYIDALRARGIHITSRSADQF
jgi:lysine 6-dehydrogenase